VATPDLKPGLAPSDMRWSHLRSLKARPPLTRLCPSHISPAGRWRWNYAVIWSALGLRKIARSSMAATPNH